MKDKTIALIHEIMQDANRCESYHCAKLLKEYGYSVARVAVQLEVLTSEDYNELFIKYS